jgi:DNA modification methylase
MFRFMEADAQEATTPPARLHLGDCRDIMATMAPDSIDAIVCDPPYGLQLMQKEWDHGVPGVEFWTAALRVAKPGCHLLAFGGTRTFHRLMVAIEDAGWEIRDTIMWVYGSGFPKSHDVSKAIDKEAGLIRDRVPGGVASSNTMSLGKFKCGEAISGEAISGEAISGEAISGEAKRWSGFGTALKPAWEPIIVARKPLVGTVAENVLRHGTGGLNIDGCRVPHDGDRLGGGRISTTTDGWDRPWKHDESAMAACLDRSREAIAKAETLGRWPANVCYDGSDEVLALFPAAKGQQGSVTGEEPSSKTNNAYGQFGARRATKPRGDAGSAARFFYCAKASRRDRNEGLDDPGPQFPHGATLRRVENTATKGNIHPTVKPTPLMRYLCRLVTPPRGTILDPFAGSGSTGKAAILEGFGFIGIELDPHYHDSALLRINAALAALSTPRS